MHRRNVRVGAVSGFGAPARACGQRETRARNWAPPRRRWADRRTAVDGLRVSAPI